MSAEPGDAERYCLFGLDEVQARGVRVRHNLEPVGEPPSWSRLAGLAVNEALHATGGYGGDFASVLRCLPDVNAAEVVFSTVDTVGIPLVLLERALLVRSRLVYAAIGLPERLQQLSGRMRRLYVGAFRCAEHVVAYARSEADWLRDWLGPGAPTVTFVPFGVDVDAFRPEPGRVADVDVVSIGADPRRDFGLLAAIAERRGELSVRIVTTAAQAAALGTVPPNVAVETDIPLADVRDRLAAARVVALPVRDNSYSGATTVLLQAMAMAKPVVVSRTEAIAEGYELEDGVNCRLVPPADEAAFESALRDLLADPDGARSIGVRARETVERGFSWERYTDALWRLLAG